MWWLVVTDGGSATLNVNWSALRVNKKTTYRTAGNNA